MIQMKRMKKIANKMMKLLRWIGLEMWCPQGVRYYQRKKPSGFPSCLFKKKLITNELRKFAMEYKLMLQKKNFEKKPLRREWERRNPDWHLRRKS
jgi:hypothetical protein